MGVRLQSAFAILFALALVLMPVSSASQAASLQMPCPASDDPDDRDLIRAYDNRTEYENGTNESYVSIYVGSSDGSSLGFEYGIRVIVFYEDEDNETHGQGVEAYCYDKDGEFENGSNSGNSSFCRNETNATLGSVAQQGAGFLESVISNIVQFIHQVIQIITGAPQEANVEDSRNNEKTAAIAIVVASSATIIGSLIATIFAILPKLIVAPFFTRISQKKALNNENRRKLYDLIKSKPGLSVRDLSRESGMDWRTVLYHISVLKRHHFISVCYSRNRHNIFENGGRYRQDEREIVSAASNENASKLIEFLKSNPGATQKEICKKLGYSAPLASWHTKYLEKMGVLEKRKEGKNVMHYIIAAQSS